ncbi:MAG: 30S ribosomal protein S3, partial [Alphaproteobacteria bacterium]|nr:30S ribosomal protein S3 [Alphaproteobacteria bacterium]
MGQKVNPISLRLGVNRTWDSRWYADEKFTDYLHEDLKIRKFLKNKLAQAGISKIVIERPAKKARVTIHSARPGVVIGKKGQDIELLRKDIQKLTDSEVQLNILEVRKPELDGKLVAESVAQQLERGVAFRLAMKRVMQSALRLGAEG